MRNQPTIGDSTARAPGPLRRKTAQRTLGLLSFAPVALVIACIALFAVTKDFWVGVLFGGSALTGGLVMIFLIAVLGVVAAGCLPLGIAGVIVASRRRAGFGWPIVGGALSLIVLAMTVTLGSALGFALF